MRGNLHTRELRCTLSSLAGTFEAFELKLEQPLKRRSCIIQISTYRRRRPTQRSSGRTPRYRAVPAAHLSSGSAVDTEVFRGSGCNYRPAERTLSTSVVRCRSWRPRGRTEWADGWPSARPRGFLGGGCNERWPIWVKAGVADRLHRRSDPPGMSSPDTRGSKRLHRERRTATGVACDVSGGKATSA